MKRSVLVFSTLLLLGCSSAPTKRDIEQDFRKLVSTNYEGIEIKKVLRINFGDGWDDGAEVRVYFDGICDVKINASNQVKNCKNGLMHMEMSYQKSSSGVWEVLSAEIIFSK